MSSGLSQGKRLASFKTSLGDDYFVLTRFEGTEGLSELFEYPCRGAVREGRRRPEQILGEVCSVKYTLRGGGTRSLLRRTRRGANGWAREASSMRVSLPPETLALASIPALRLQDLREQDRAGNHQGDLQEGRKEEFRRQSPVRAIPDDGILRPVPRNGPRVRPAPDGAARDLLLFQACRGRAQARAFGLQASHDQVKAPSGRGGAAADYPFLPARQVRTGGARSISSSGTRSGGCGRGGSSSPTTTTSSRPPTLRRSKEEGIAGRKEVRGLRLPWQVYRAQRTGQRFAEIRVQAQQALDASALRGGRGAEPLPWGAVQAVGPSDHVRERAAPRRPGAPFLRAAGLSHRGRLPARPSPIVGRYEFLESERRFRAPIVTPKPLVHGPQTAKVVAQKRQQGEEIDVDEYGCIYVQFHWDRDRDTTSRRVRVAQVWSGKGWGGQVIPRIGQEVVVEFLEGDPDEPLGHRHGLQRQVQAALRIAGRTRPSRG